MRFVVTALALCFITNCSAGNLAAIHKKSSFSIDRGGGPVGVFVDAEQRAVLSNIRPAQFGWVEAPDGELKWVQMQDSRLVVCAEPSPDALSAIAAQAGLSVSDVSRAVSAQGGLSETAASMGLRTQTIQTLRDGFYRVCEAYMNGLSDAQYSMMLRRFQTNMIALLAIEQLTGAVKGSDALVAAASGSAINFQQVYLERANLAAAQISRMEKEIEGIDKQIAAAKQTNKDCEKNTGTENESAGCSANDVQARREKIVIMENEKSALETRRDIAEASKTTNEKLAESAPSSTDAQVGGVLLASPLYSTPTTAVAEAVEEISLAIIRQDYGTQLCLEYLRAGIAQGSGLEDACVKVLSAYAEAKQNQADSLAKKTELIDRLLDAVLEDNTIDDSEAPFVSALLGIEVSSQPTVSFQPNSIPTVAEHRKSYLNEWNDWDERLSETPS